MTCTCMYWLIVKFKAGILRLHLCKLSIAKSAFGSRKMNWIQCSCPTCRNNVVLFPILGEHLEDLLMYTMTYYAWFWIVELLPTHLAFNHAGDRFAWSATHRLGVDHKVYMYHVPTDLCRSSM